MCGEFTCLHCLWFWIHFSMIILARYTYMLVNMYCIYLITFLRIAKWIESNASPWRLAAGPVCTLCWYLVHDENFYNLLNFYYKFIHSNFNVLKSLLSQTCTTFSFFLNHYFLAVPLPATPLSLLFAVYHFQMSVSNYLKCSLITLSFSILIYLYWRFIQYL